MEPGAAPGEEGEEYPGRMLQQAALYNNLEFLESLLQGGERAHINARDPYGRTALYTSVTNNSLECGHMLLQAGADANLACGAQCGRMTPLHAAASDNKQKFVSILLQYGAAVNQRDGSGKKPIDLAEQNRSEECLAILKSEIEAKEKQMMEVHDDFVEACNRGMVERATELSKEMMEKEVRQLVNDIPEGGNSLLYRACENGHVDMVDLLLTLGADVQVHPVTGFSPLHGACLHGHTECVEFMLKFFPELIRAPTIDGTFPLHMACAEGHDQIVDLLLAFPYPDLVKKLFKESRGERMYRLGLALNAKDGHGRTPLHIAVSGDHASIVRRLLEFRVSVALRYHDGVVEEIKPEEDGSPERGAGAREISPQVEEATEKVYVRQSRLDQFCPVEVDLMDLDGYTPLHLAVIGDADHGFHRTAALLLQHKADPNEPFRLPGGVTSPLLEACRRGDVTMMELLLRHGAKDDEQTILSTAVRSGSPDVIAAMIQYRSHGDSEYKVNYLSVMEETLGREDMTSSTSLKSLWPNAPVTINWHMVGLRALHTSWLLKACLLHVGRPPGGQCRTELALYAITRMDISNNKLTALPAEVFRLPSLRILNASHNRLRFLLPSAPRGSEAPPREGGGRGSPERDPGEGSGAPEWRCPLLEEVYLAKNKLRSVPAQLFTLPALTKVTLAHNEIAAMPYAMWTCPSLSELNLSHNQLHGLPHQPASAPPDVGLSLQVDSVSLGSAGGDSPLPSNHNTPKHHPSSAGPPYSSSPARAADRTASPAQPAPQEGLDEVPEALEISVGTLKKCQEGLTLKFHTHWQDKVRVRVTSLPSEQKGQPDKQVRLTELNLSQNRFENVPLGLACLAPHLTKLTLSYNLLTQVGPMENYPASLKTLDLSCNKITNDVLFECSYSGSGADGEGPGAWSIKTCYSPQYHGRGRSMSKGQSSGRLSSRSGRAGSTASLQSLSSTTSGPQYTCVHRMHKQLEKLRTLKLSNNKLARLVLTLSVDVDEDTESSSEDVRGVPANRRKRLSAASDTSETQRVELFYPNLSVLDVCYNSLVTLPSEISELIQLAELKVAHNRLKELPPDMGLLKKLWNLDYKGCPVENSLQSLLGEKAKKTSSVLSYLKSIKEEATLYNRMKLMFVGIQGIGKTSLLEQLRRVGRSRTQQKNWAQRMGHLTSQDKDLKGENISTVGVDIGDLVLQRDRKEVVFSTWDFGGQKEYYATHQYFLSKRSLYLVVWKVTDGEKGVNEIQQWLVNIQARAPNSPVIIIGTHMDLLSKRYPPSYLHELQRRIFEKYQAHTEPEKSGLPRVLGRVEVSCKPKILYNDHIADLVNLIWSVTCDEQLPGNKGARLLEQKVPASYVHLEVVVRRLAVERKKEGKDPVLHSEQYKPLVIHKMEEMYNTSFRDVAELNQATQFLHENGVLLHYDDVNLADIYFLDPQWLCDMLANVVTIREINSLAKCGIMKTEDLRILFKNSAFKPEDIKTYVINLLNKFEVALLWDERNLLIPSLLPTEVESKSRRLRGHDVRVPLKGVNCCHSLSTSTHRVLTSNVMLGQQDGGQPAEGGDERSSYYIEPASAGDEEFTTVSPDRESSSPGEEPLPIICSNPNPAVSIVRLYLMAYFPSGFWPRLITRLLADDTLHRMVDALYALPELLRGNPRFTRATLPHWRCWQSGLELVYLGVVVFRIKEASRDAPADFCDYHRCKLVVKHHDQELAWTPLNLTGTSILEVLIPNETLTVSVFSSERDECLRTLTLQPVTQAAAALLAAVVEHVDTLLEDWYPDLGARFVQNAKGMYLITRVVPCSRCLLVQIEHQCRRARTAVSEPWSMVEVNAADHSAQITQPIVINPQGSPGAGQGGGSPGARLTAPGDGGQAGPTRRVAESAPVCGYLDSVMGGRQAVGSVGSLPDTSSAKSSPTHKGTAGGGESGGEPPRPELYCYLVEQCLQAAQSNRIVFCPLHGNLGPYFVASEDGHVQHAHVAPDSVFQDVGEDYLVYQDLITRGRFLGKGAFGAVYAGTMVDKKSGGNVSVAMKMLQPVKPTSDATPSQLQQYEMDKMRWDKDPMKNACEAYLNARKELSILLSLHHENIVPLLGVSLQPLCLILRLAPLGNLSEQLSEYRRAGARLPVYAITTIIKQVASALGYLHKNQIIYRDLKSENVLVWRLPQPYHAGRQPVEVKLADYGVSRTVLPSGTKGLAGTPPFIAPEIIQHNGEESYTEKVDCFSFGMFLYELLVLRLPFEGEGTAAAGGANLKGHILAGGRPTISSKEMCYPTHILDLMTLCWANDPGERPGAEEILALAETAAFPHLYSAIEMAPDTTVLAACAAHICFDMAFSIDELNTQGSPENQSDLWISTRCQSTGEGSLHVYTYHQQECSQARKVSLGGTEVCCMCVAGQWVWCADTSAVIHVFSQEEYVEVLKFPATTRPSVQVKCMAYGAGENQVYVVMDNGRFILCETEFPIEFSVNYTPVKTECPGNGKAIHCLGLLQTTHHSSELWCGQAAGRISIWDLHSTQGSLRKAIHPGGATHTGDVLSIATCHADPASVWSYVYPGTVVYRWDSRTLRVVSQLDIKQYGVSNGTAQSATQIVGRSQVTAMTVVNTELYLGTTAGCLIVADKLAMLPLAICPCHAPGDPYVHTVISLSPAGPGDAGSGEEEEEDAAAPASRPLVATIGRGYQDQIGRVLPSQRRRQDADNNNFILTWGAEHWDTPV